MPKQTIVQKSTSFLSSSVFLTGGVLLVVFLGWMAVNEYFRERAINVEVAKLRLAIADVEGKNKELQTSLSYLQTSEFQELEAKRQLGVAGEGEGVIIVTNTNGAPKSLQSDKASRRSGNEDLPNPQKWWKYFFDI